MRECFTWMKYSSAISDLFCTWTLFNYFKFIFKIWKKILQDLWNWVHYLKQIQFNFRCYHHSSNYFFKCNLGWRIVDVRVSGELAYGLSLQRKFHYMYIEICFYLRILDSKTNQLQFNTLRAHLTYLMQNILHLKFEQ